MEAVFRFIEHQQRRQPRTEQGRRQQQIAQGAIGELRGLKRSQQSRLVQLHAKDRLRNVHGQAAGGECVGNGGLKGIRVADLQDRLHRRRQIAAVAGQRWRAGGNATAAGRGLAIGAEAVVEAPAEDGVAQLEHFRRFERIGDSGEETLVGRHLQGQGAAGPAFPAALDHGASALHQQAAGMEWAASPDPLPLDLRIEHEGAGVVVGPVAQLDGVGEGFAGDAQPQPRRLPPTAAALHRLLTAAHLPGGALRPGPEHRRQAPFGRQGRHQITPGGGGNQPQ